MLAQKPLSWIYHRVSLYTLDHRIHKHSKHNYTGGDQNVIYGWERNTLAFKSNDQVAKHCAYEKGLFLPFVQAV